jgi:uncharacterized protein (TIGR02246 family)
MAGDAHQPDESGVRKVIADFGDAWDRHDAKAMAALHTEDVNFINIFGEWWKSRAEVKRISRGPIPRAAGWPTAP